MKPTLGWSARLERLLSPPYFEATTTGRYRLRLKWSRRWSTACPTTSPKPDGYPVDGRGITSSIASIGIKHLEVRQLYLMTVMDKDGNALDEASSYRLAVPAKVPINQYWSATTYDKQSHPDAFIRGVERHLVLIAGRQRLT